MFIERPNGLLRLHAMLQGVITLLLMGGVFAFFQLLNYASSAEALVHLRYAAIFFGAMFFEHISRSNEQGNLFALAERRKLSLSQKQVMLPMISVLGALFLFREPNLSRGLLVSWFLVYGAWIFWSNAQLPSLLSKWLYSTKRVDAAPVLLIANAREARRFRQRVRKGEFLGIRVVGYVDFGECDSEDCEIRNLGSIGDLDAICAEQEVEGIIAVNAHCHDDIILTLSQFCDHRSIRFMLFEDLFARYGRRFVPHSLGNTDLVFTMPEPLENPVNQMMKRVLDIGIALIALTFVFPPVAVLVAIIHRLHSPGPLFFVQRRSGQGGRSFPIVKFRTMSAAKRDESVQAKKHDPRVFKGGAFLRRFSLDEIPQFYNVLVGDMSVVGPRPHLPSHDELFTSVSANYPVRRFAKPGITGLAQIKGCRGEAIHPREVRNRVRWDIAYIRQWSIILDISIIFMTVKEAISPSERAY
jgi:exopolysaccharide biosynthesis polyprenyl glycosylphosphotransferase